MKKISVIFVKGEIEGLPKKAKEWQLEMEQKQNAYIIKGNIDRVAKFLQVECNWCEELNVDLEGLTKVLLDVMNNPFSRVKSC